MTKAVSGKSSKRSTGIHDHRQLRQLISGIRDGVILVDLDQTILWANDPALAMHGASSLSELDTSKNLPHSFDFVIRSF